MGDPVADTEDQRFIYETNMQPSFVESVCYWIHATCWETMIEISYCLQVLLIDFQILHSLEDYFYINCATIHCIWLCLENALETPSGLKYECPNFGSDGFLEIYQSAS